MTDLVAFLRARLDADEADAPGEERPERCRREVAAKRAILGEYTAALAAQNEMLATPAGDQSVTYEWENGRVCALLNALRGFAAIYRDHPDYDEAWKP